MTFFFRMKRDLMIFLILHAESSMAPTESVKVHCISQRSLGVVFFVLVMCSRDMGSQSNNLVAIHGSP